MNEKIDQFCDNLRDRLTEVDTRIKRFKENMDAVNTKAKDEVRSQLDKAKTNYDARKQEAVQAKERIKALVEQKVEETEATIQEWKRQRKIDKMAGRAQRAEDYAAARALLALAAVEEAEFAMLEAIEARIEANEVADATD